MDYQPLLGRIERIVRHELRATLGAELQAEAALLFNGMPVHTQRSTGKSSTAFTVTVDTGAHVDELSYTILPAAPYLVASIHQHDRSFVSLEGGLPWVLGGFRPQLHPLIPELSAEPEIRWAIDDHSKELSLVSRLMVNHETIRSAELSCEVVHAKLLEHTLATLLVDTLVTFENLPVVGRLSIPFRHLAAQSMPGTLDGCIITSDGHYYGNFGDYTLVAHVEPLGADDLATARHLRAVLDLSWTSEDDPAFYVIDQWDQAFGDTFRHLWRRVQMADESSSSRCHMLWRSRTGQERHVVCHCANMYQEQLPSPNRERSFVRSAVQDFVHTSVRLGATIDNLARLYQSLCRIALEKGGAQRTAANLVEIQRL